LPSKEQINIEIQQHQISNKNWLTEPAMSLTIFITLIINVEDARCCRLKLIPQPFKIESDDGKTPISLHLQQPINAWSAEDRQNHKATSSTDRGVAYYWGTYPI
jgi:hypothetical protein